ncbi:hypothetical protein BDEG_23369 [Batrachochytrium dendrobatidis JEL423]|uniref:Uncharacterized protein n=1 Tax=Batrachochytrium dendrobatidis (strain JEL423) TaxID=403673 RepID=A0A177WJ68_BATDL|nr:hypothetical protein BDEG_23369 [Batrachochytrium dendrobatidis JEL423]
MFRECSDGIKQIAVTVLWKCKFPARLHDCFRLSCRLYKEQVVQQTDRVDKPDCRHVTDRNTTKLGISKKFNIYNQSTDEKELLVVGSIIFLQSLLKTITVSN